MQPRWFYWEASPYYKQTLNLFALKKNSIVLALIGNVEFGKYIFFVNHNIVRVDFLKLFEEIVVKFGVAIE